MLGANLALFLGIIDTPLPKMVEVGLMLIIGMGSVVAILIERTHNRLAIWCPRCQEEAFTVTEDE